MIKKLLKLPSGNTQQVGTDNESQKGRKAGNVQSLPYYIHFKIKLIICLVDKFASSSEVTFSLTCPF